MECLVHCHDICDCRFILVLIPPRRVYEKSSKSIVEDDGVGGEIVLEADVKLCLFILVQWNVAARRV